MKAQWNKIAARINALSERERVILFLSIVVSLLAIGDSLWFTPALRVQKELAQKFGAQAAELDTLRVELVQNGHTVNPNQQARDELAALQKQLDQAGEDIGQLLPSAPSGPGLERVLVEFLRKQDGLTLLGTGTLKDDGQANPAVPNPLNAAAGVLASGTIIVPPASSASNTPNSGKATNPPGNLTLTRRGMELRVSGSYVELTRYVKTLENALPQLRWGPMQLKADKNPPELTLTVYVLGVHS